ncbi:MAG TPA: TetR/AcrR family transcriptional regulator [Kineosporiaceae bacterium]|nr:TetR/AcrR family transcriptional regulator [Kineosporiaceae bacterium]
MGTEAAREQLLGRVVAFAAAEGIAGRSLREIAGGVGTSHRMLLYHFGSREGLLAAIVATIEAQQRDVMTALTQQGGTPREVMLGLWEQLTRPELLPFVRLFFEVFGLLAQDSPATRPLRASLTAPWVSQGLAGAERLGIGGDPAELRVGIAVTRGLLLELVAGTPLAEVDSAYRRFVDLYDAAAGT